jgi:hypothetical protein
MSKIRQYGDEYLSLVKSDVDAKQQECSVSWVDIQNTIKR